MRTSVRVVAVLVVAGVLLAAGMPVSYCQQIGAKSSRGFAAHTHATLLADLRSVQPGASLTLGVLLTMDKGWHTYWKNPGEAGLATEIVWKVPKGLAVGGILWPVPEKLIESGDILTYGYGDEVMLLVPCSVASDFQPGQRISISADLTWLECAETCVPGKQSVSLTLPASASTPESDHVSLFTKYRARIPQTLSGIPGTRTRVSLSEGSVTLDVALPSVVNDVDFYPELVRGVTFGRPDVGAEGTAVRITVPIASVEGSDTTRVLRGIFLYTDSSGIRRAATIDAPFSPAETGTVVKGLMEFEFRPTNGGEEHSFVLYLAFAFIGGLLLNIMPCVLPVIALKIFGIVRMAGDQPQRIRRLGWAFALGIMASFLVLAIVVLLLQFAGQQVGWGFQFQEPLFVIVMSAVVFAFGLSLFGVYEIRLPAHAVEGVGNVLQNREGGYGASFAEGAFATVLATPCTAPFLGTALGFAFSQPAWAIVLIFLVIAAGMSLPYVVLTAKPAWMKYLPKPGAWMETAKQFMGFFMMATLLWLLYILGRQIGVEGIVWTAAFLLVIGVACWMIGRFVTLSASVLRTVVVWLGAVVLIVIGIVVCIVPVLEARQVIVGNGGGYEPANGIRWEPFVPARLDSLLRGNKAVLLDFTADWCLTCKVNEKTVLANDNIIKQIKATGIVPVRADWTQRNPDISRLLSRFGRSGVPLYVVFPAGNPSKPIVLPEVITVSILQEAINKASGGTRTEDNKDR